MILLALDLGVLHRRAHIIKMREALLGSAFWICLAIAFGAVIWLWRGQQNTLEYFTGYLIEKSLSADNVFVFSVIMSYFAVPQIYQHRVLFWGILGALVMRLSFIAAGIVVIHAFEWIIYVFGGFLVVTGVRLWFQKEQEIHPERNPILRLLQRVFQVTKGYENGHFFIRNNGKLLATPLFIVLVVIESTDVIFALDSIPAILAITLDPFIVYSSNVFAILGLRALYFMLAGARERFEYLHFGLAAILVFVGAKMILSGVQVDIPINIALGFVGIVLLFSILASWFITNRRNKLATT
jgi:tellurite resistance protein TerC